jgi:hypothetical protein
MRFLTVLLDDHFGYNRRHRVFRLARCWVSTQRGRRTLGARIASSGNWTDRYSFAENKARLSLRRQALFGKETARLGCKTDSFARLWIIS